MDVAKSNAENIAAFIDSVSFEHLRQFLQVYIEDIRRLGAATRDERRQARQRLASAILELIKAADKGEPRKDTHN